ncbi:MAG: ribulose-phosphate 3-epimerase [Elusimicrobiales bacterium]|jgi:ribulose-phosphate 3-epimerase|nr:ribulose-phosphate 3-epimerase [Elusimicrobiales bacterium]NLH38501.1 ribulose-phosphate 3-epimerase [Elusimicrobiota bacterium]
MKFPDYKDNFIVPSVLSADFSCLKKEIKKVEKYSGWIQLDVMDGHFVDNLSFGPHVAKCLKNVTELPLDVHLMVEEPVKFVKPFIDSGAGVITSHFESNDFLKAIKMVKDAGIKAGIAIKPRTPAKKILKYIPLVDLILVMTVEPGFGGQSFMYDMLDKIKEIRDYLTINKLNKYLQVDGGINENTLIYALNSGANSFVMGSALFSKNNPSFIKRIAKSIK